MRNVLDASVALLAEAYRTYGMDWFQAMEQAMTVGLSEEEKKQDAPPPDDEAALAALNAMMAGTGRKFGG